MQCLAQDLLLLPAGADGAGGLTAQGCKDRAPHAALRLIAPVCAGAAGVQNVQGGQLRRGVYAGDSVLLLRAPTTAPSTTAKHAQICSHNETCRVICCQTPALLCSELIEHKATLACSRCTKA